MAMDRCSLEVGQCEVEETDQDDSSSRSVDRVAELLSLAKDFSTDEVKELESLLGGKKNSTHALRTLLCAMAIRRL